MKICNKCAEETNRGKWIWDKWFCDTCLEYTNISPDDCYGTDRYDMYD